MVQRHRIMLQYNRREYPFQDIPSDMEIIRQLNENAHPPLPQPASYEPYRADVRQAHKSNRA